MRPTWRAAIVATLLVVAVGGLFGADSASAQPPPPDPCTRNLEGCPDPDPDPDPDPSPFDPSVCLVQNYHGETVIDSGNPACDCYFYDQATDSAVFDFDLCEPGRPTGERCYLTWIRGPLYQIPIWVCWPL